MRGLVTGFEPDRSAHGSITVAVDRPGASRNFGATSAPVPSVDMNGTWLPVHQSHTWCPWNATLPVRVSAV